MVVVVKPQVFVLLALGPSLLWRSHIIPLEHSLSVLLTNPHCVDRALRHFREGLQDEPTLRPREQGKGGWDRSLTWLDQCLTFGLCLPTEKVFTGCYLKQPQRTSTRTLNSTRWTREHGTQTSTPTVSGPIR